MMSIDHMIRTVAQAAVDIAAAGEDPSDVGLSALEIREIVRQYQDALPPATEPLSPSQQLERVHIALRQLGWPIPEVDPRSVELWKALPPLPPPVANDD